ncbi:hypothetical protein JCM8208_001152 [Rhodotorula glutinis]
MENLMKFGQQAYKQYQDSQDNQGNNQHQQQQPYANQQQQYGDDSNSPYPQPGGQQQHDFTGGRQHAGQGDGAFGIQGGSQFNSHDNRPPQQGSGGFLSSLNQDQTVQQASNESNEDQGLFASALSFLNGRDDDDDIDEDRVQKAHQEAYSSGQSNMSANSMGAAAAMQALKSFTSGSGGQQQQSGGGGMQSKLIAMAMSEATKLFAQNGGASNGNKQDVVNSAAQTMMKLMLKNQVSGMTGGSQGGMGSLFSMAQKFM